ncbi:MAG: tetratricopeptide repeat protein, partial [Alphaproteobacteria bacterium]|nr:tetratricopeptide repeat protein [Alphaproteobacteria bacterium]
CFERAVRVRPKAAVLHRELGNARRDAGDGIGARRALETAVLLAPREVENHNALGLACRAVGDMDAAVRCFDSGLALEPGNVGLAYNRAMTLQLWGRLDDAISGYDRVLEGRPDMLDAINNRARALHDLGRVDEAIWAFRTLLLTEPAHSAGWNNIGIGFRDDGKLDRAARAFERSLATDPGNGEVLNNLGAAVWATGDETRAIAAYEQARSARPDLADASLNLAFALAGQGRHDGAVAIYDTGGREHPDDARFPIRRALSLPQICLDTKEISTLRAGLEKFLASDAARALRVEDPISAVGSANFYWVYHGLNDRPQQEAIADFHRLCCPRLSWVAPHCRDSGSSGPARRPRIGICSKYLNRHTIGLLFAGVIERLGESGAFELIILRPPGRHDDIARRIDAAADHVVNLPASLAKVQEVIAEARLDVLLYPDIGMEPITYFLAFARLAPVQFVTWGHPVTTGLASLDGYLSPDVFEPDNGEDHYAEGLKRLDNILMHYEPPGAPVGVAKEGFGLPASGAAYVCPQNIFKLHPDFDGWMADILRADPDGRVVLIEGAKEGWTRRLRHRLSKAMPDVVERVTFLPYLPTQKYFELVAAADVLLDPIHFGGGNTTFHGLSLGTPLVTTPGAFQRSRFASGTYRTIGLEGLVARDRADYVSRAVALGRDRAHREQVSGRVKDAARALHRRHEAADELGEVLLEAVERHFAR